ncbi:MAG: hypothetical protein ACREFA_06995 [Stellaceae bacterium]
MVSLIPEFPGPFVISQIILQKLLLVIVKRQTVRGAIGKRVSKRLSSARSAGARHIGLLARVFAILVPALAAQGGKLRQMKSKTLQIGDFLGWYRSSVAFSGKR